MIPRIREVHLRNYRSIEEAVVRLSDFTVLVGPNGAGKSTFVDALAFVQECLATSVEAALRQRGGVLRNVRGIADAAEVRMGFRVVIELKGGSVADYAFEILASRNGTFTVAEERCVVSVGGRERNRFDLRNGEFRKAPAGIRAVIEPDRLALYAASSLDEFRPVYDFLVGVRAYDIDPEKLRDLRDPSPGLILERDGGNAAAVLRELEETNPERFTRVLNLLSAVVPGITRAEGATVGGKQFLFFAEGGTGADTPLGLFPVNMSDGTLRMLGLLLSVYQPSTPTVLLIEEPEATIHPAAAEVVMSVLLDAAKRSQVIVTTHSPDVLDFKTLPETSIRVVTKGSRGTAVAPVSNSSRDAIRQRLYSAGELLRTDELNPDTAAAELLASEHDLFGEPVHAFGEDG